MIHQQGFKNKPWIVLKWQLSAFVSRSLNVTVGILNQVHKGTKLHD